MKFIRDDNWKPDYHQQHGFILPATPHTNVKKIQKNECREKKCHCSFEFADEVKLRQRRGRSSSLWEGGQALNPGRILLNYQWMINGCSSPITTGRVSERRRERETVRERGRGMSKEKIFFIRRKSVAGLNEEQYVNVRVPVGEEGEGSLGG